MAKPAKYAPSENQPRTPDEELQEVHHDEATLKAHRAQLYQQG